MDELLLEDVVVGIVVDAVDTIDDGGVVVLDVDMVVSFVVDGILFMTEKKKEEGRKEESERSSNSREMCGGKIKSKSHVTFIRTQKMEMHVSVQTNVLSFSHLFRSSHCLLKEPDSLVPNIPFKFPALPVTINILPLKADYCLYPLFPQG